MIDTKIPKRVDEALEKSGAKPTKKLQNARFWFDREDFSRRPYQGLLPSCIKQLLRGVSSIDREEALRCLTPYYLEVEQRDPDYAKRKLRSWNKRCDPPLEDDEFEAIFSSACRESPIYGCNDSILKSRCNPKVKCPLRKTVEEERKIETEFDAETESRINEEVTRILEADNQLKALGQHLDEVIVGESGNKRAILVLLTGSKYGTPDKLAIITIKGGSRGGKSHEAKILASGFNTKKVGRFTAHGLDYADLDPYEVLYIQELGEMDEEKSGLSRLKFLDGDDQGFVVEYPVRDELTGRMTNETRRIPPKTVVSTTVRISLEHQFANRSWMFSVDESSQQTERVLQWKAERKRQEDEKLAGLRKVTDYEYSKEVLKRVIRRIKPHNIIVPFRKTITRVFNPRSSLRIRADIDKIYTFIELYSNFNLKRLLQLEANRTEFYATTPEVAVEALDIIKGIVSRMLAGIESRTKEVLEALNEIDVEAGLTDPRLTGEEASPIKVHPNVVGSRISKKIREQIARLLGVSDTTVRKRLNALVSSGYLSSDETRGRKGTTYTLLYDVSEILRKLSEESGILESPHSLMSEMKEEAQKWLKSKCGIQFGKEASTNLSQNQDAKEVSAPSPELFPHSRIRENQRDSEEKREENAEK